MDRTDAKDWEYRCINCGHLALSDNSFSESCPKCRGNKWACRWLRDAARGTSRPEVLRDKASGHTKPPERNLSQPFQQTGAVPEPGKPHNRRGPKSLPVGDLVRELAGQGLSSRKIAARLQQQGLTITYKTVQRRLQEPLFS